jgi:hypothetical protein
VAHDPCDAVILDAAKLGVADPLAGMLSESLAQLSGTQQAPDVIGAERRAAGGQRGHGRPSFERIL